MVFTKSVINTNKSFVFTHLTDPHLSSPDFSWPDLITKRVLGYLLWKTSRCHEHLPEIINPLVKQALADGQHMVITGDLTQVSRVEEFKQVRVWLESLGDPDKITIVPGNHDAYLDIPWATTMGLWEPWLRSEQNLNNEGSVFPSVHYRGPVAFIGLSTAVPSWPFRATGEISKQQIESLPRILSTAGSAGYFRVILMHHSPIRGNNSNSHRLINSSSIGKILNQEGAELILHGHDHRINLTEIETNQGVIPVLCSSSASALGLDKRGKILAKRRASYFRCKVIPDATKAGKWLLVVSTRQLDADHRVRTVARHTWVLTRSATRAR